jgi:predicted small metal-binding protein
MQEYQCDVVITWSGNSMEADSVEEYKEKVRELYFEEHNIKDIRDKEITNIKKV